jgi:hypothetical protein
LKIIWRDKHRRETESERVFILHVPAREGEIIAEALNAHALGNDWYECVRDEYILYRFRVSTKGYFLALSQIWERWFESRKGGEPFSMQERDAQIARLQKEWTPDRPMVKKEEKKLKIKLELAL